MSDLLPGFHRVLLERKLLAPRARVLLAVSGGVDSMVLLDLFRRAYETCPERLVVAHFNHRLRGASSDADERFVQAAARRLGLKCATGSADVRGFSRAQKISIEMAARKLRHEFLATTARQHQAGSIAMAHHADDQVELFFVRLLRGSSPAGLVGMKWRAPSPADARVMLVRPLLEFTKSQLEAHSRARRIKFREDATNRRPEFLRNRIRGRLLPLLKRDYQPGLTQVVSRLIEMLTAETEFVQSTAAKWKANPRRTGFSRLPVAVQRCILERQVVEKSVEPDFAMIETLRCWPKVPVTIALGKVIERDEDGQLNRRKAAEPEFNSAATSIDLGLKKRVQFGDVSVKWDWVSPTAARRAIRARGSSRSRVDREWFDADKVGKPIVLRHWQPGDQFHPIGMPGAVKLQDWFVNRKIPRSRRHELVVAVAADGRIFWVEDQRISEAFKLDKGTTRSLKWRWTRT